MVGFYADWSAQCKSTKDLLQEMLMDSEFEVVIFLMILQLSFLQWIYNFCALFLCVKLA